jgi:hypothetical protein
VTNGTLEPLKTVAVILETPAYSEPRITPKFSRRTGGADRQAGRFPGFCFSSKPETFRYLVRILFLDQASNPFLAGSRYR